MQIDPYYMGSECAQKRSYPESQEAECLKTSQRELQEKKDKIMWKIISNLKSIQLSIWSENKEFQECKVSKLVPLMMLIDSVLHTE